MHLKRCCLDGGRILWLAPRCAQKHSVAAVLNAPARGRRRSASWDRDATARSSRFDHNSPRPPNYGLTTYIVGGGAGAATRLALPIRQSPGTTKGSLCTYRSRPSRCPSWRASPWPSARASILRPGTAVLPTGRGHRLVRWGNRCATRPAASARCSAVTSNAAGLHDLPCEGRRAAVCWSKNDCAPTTAVTPRSVVRCRSRFTADRAARTGEAAAPD